jgi:hypothetical protein
MVANWPQDTLSYSDHPNYIHTLNSGRRATKSLSVSMSSKQYKIVFYLANQLAISVY